jgi:hypothetical protein
MSTTVNDTMSAATNGMESAKDRAGHAIGTARSGIASIKDGTGHTILNAVSMLTKGISTAAGIVAMLRSLDRNDGLAWFGLSRRRSPLVSIAIFAAGAAVGAGAGLLFAPMSGADMRRTLLGAAKDLKPNATHTIEGAESEGHSSRTT